MSQKVFVLAGLAALLGACSAPPPSHGGWVDAGVDEDAPLLEDPGAPPAQDGSTGTTPGKPSPSDAGARADVVHPPVDLGTDGGASDDGGPARSDAGTSDGGAATPACETPLNTCDAPFVVDPISGDSGGTTQAVTGVESAWIRVRMTEDSTGPLAAPMKLTATLDSPVGANFDLYVYYDPDQDVAVCSAAAAMSTQPSGLSDTVQLVWGETGTFANGSDDSRTVAVEIRFAGGTCSPGAEWKLTLEGNR